MNQSDFYQQSNDFKLSSSRPKVVVGVLIYKDNEILLGTGKKFKGKWVLFGGHLEMGETLEECAIKEAKEETNLDVKNPKFICYVQSIGSQEFTMKKHFIFMNFSVEAKKKEVSLAENEIQEYKWFSFDEILEQDLNTSTRETIEIFLEGRKE